MPHNTSKQPERATSGSPAVLWHGFLVRFRACGLVRRCETMPCTNCVRPVAGGVLLKCRHVVWDAGTSAYPFMAGAVRSIRWRDGKLSWHRGRWDGIRL